MKPYGRAHLVAGVHIRIIINARAGSVLGRAPEEVISLVKPLFEVAGQVTSFVVCAPDSLEGAVRDAVSNGCRRIIVGGGDGSVRTAAKVLAGSGVSLGILPLGTLNLLAKDLGLPLAIEAAARELANGRPHDIDVASVNGAPFLCNSIMGLPTLHSVNRRRMRGQPFLVRLRGYARILGAILASRRRYAISIDDGTEVKRMRVLSLAVSNNGYEDIPDWKLRRPELDGGYLTLYLSKHRNGWAMVRALIRAVIGSWSGDPYLTHIRTRVVRIGSSRPFVRVVNDGEIELMRTPLTYEIRPKALSILVPNSAARESAADGRGSSTRA